jgi:hypothetical protein
MTSIIYEGAPVTDLETAFGWLPFNAESGTGLNLVGGTTAGHSEYRIFLKADQLIGKSQLIYPAGINYVSLELYGAGVPGGAERTIKRNPSWNQNFFYEILNNNQSIRYDGLISLIDFSGGRTIFILGKNVTLHGNDEVTDMGTGMNQIGVQYLLYVSSSADNVVIMRDHAKITGYNTSTASRYYVPIYIDTSSTTYRTVFYMEGGEISGNIFGTGAGVAFLRSTNRNSFYKTGGVITGNTRDRVIQYNYNTADVDISIIPPGWPGAAQ